MRRQPHCVCINLRRLARLTTQLYDGAMADSGLKITQYSLLCAIARSEPAALSALAYEVDLDRTTLARNLNPLERDGLVALAEGNDRRVTEVTLTARGRAAIERARPQWERAQRQVMQRIGTERAALIRTLAAELGEDSKNAS